MAYQGKTDWNYDDLVTEQDMNRIEQGIEELSDELVKKEAHSLTLVPGIQNVTSERDTPLRVIGIKGRTLVNLLGRDGNCEDLSRWGRYQVTNELDEDNFTIGTRGLKTVSASSGGGSSYSAIRVSLEPTKFYILLGMLKNGTAVGTSLSISGSFAETRSNVVRRGDRFELAYSKINGYENEQSSIAVNITGPQDSYVFADEIRLYEITEEEYQAIDDMTPDEIASTYPYVDSLQNVNAVYITTRSMEDDRNSYLYLPACQLASNMDGTVADQMYVDNEGKPRVVRHFRRMELTGDLDWAFNTAPIGGTYKEVRLPLTNSIPNTGYVVKYDGKIIYPVNPLNGPDQFNHNNGFFRVTIPNVDSGWGSDYTPSNDEVMAYFNGWRMWTSGQDSKTDQYNGTGTKYWGYWDGNGNIVNGTSTLPTTSAYANSNAAYKPYQLQYQLVQPADEPLEYEGSLMLCKGNNQIEVGTGTVVWEKANPRQSETSISINGGNEHSSRLTNRALKLLQVYRNGTPDLRWDLIQRNIQSDLYGIGAASLDSFDFDPLAVYQVTYLALDTYKLGIAPSSISAEYALNLRGTVEDLVQRSKDVKTRISVVESQMQMKEASPPQWITPVLLNGWVPYGSAFPIGYSKDGTGNVWVKGLAKDGIVSQNPETGAIFVLPPGYRPAEEKSFAVRSGSTNPTAQVLGAIIVNPNGRVRAYSGNNTLLSLTEILFRAEH